MTSTMTSSMTKPINAAFSLLLMASLTLAASGQAAPTSALPSSGFQLPDVEGSLQYALSASERVAFGYNGSSGAVSSTAFSGDFGYLSKSQVHPFSVIYSGGYLINTQAQPSSAFHNLALSQVLNSRRYHFIISDSVSYLPNSPISGLSGIPGVGDLGVPPVAIDPGFTTGILTNFAPRITNNTTATLQRDLTGSTAIEASGSFGILRFAGPYTSGGIESDQARGLGGISHRISARQTIAGDYTATKFTYIDSDFSFLSQGANLEYIAQLSRKLRLDVSAGPEWTSSKQFASTMLSVAANLNLAYIGHFTTAAVSYTRGTNAGSGLIFGGRTDNLSFLASHASSKVWTEAASVTYTHSASLEGLSTLPFSSNVVIGSVQVSRLLRHSLSAFASYTVQRQSVQGLTTALTAFDGVSQIIGVGLTYSPALIHLGHR